MSNFLIIVDDKLCCPFFFLFHSHLIMATLLPKLCLEKSQVFLTQLLLNLLRTKMQLIWVKMEMRQVGCYFFLCVLKHNINFLSSQHTRPANSQNQKIWRFWEDRHTSYVLKWMIWAKTSSFQYLDWCCYFFYFFNLGNWLLSLVISEWYSGDRYNQSHGGRGRVSSARNQ